MSRADRRALERRLRSATRNLAHPVPDSVSLLGGPMDGWVVKPDAPALRPDWAASWPPSVARRSRPGRYELEPDGKRARWHEDAA